jgi:hypothetical protein
MGRGSEVLGYDDSMSADHTWFARVTVFVAEEVLTNLGDSLLGRLTERIPAGSRVPTEITVTTVHRFFLDGSSWTCQTPGTPMTGSASRSSC